MTHPARRKIPMDKNMEAMEHELWTTRHCFNWPRQHGTPLVVVDHKVLRENYQQFRKHLPRVQVYYAVKANSDPAIVQTFYDAGASFDVASMAEFLTVHEMIKHLPAEAAAGLHLGSHHLREPDQGDRNAAAAGPLQAAGHLR